MQLKVEYLAAIAVVAVLLLVFVPVLFFICLLGGVIYAGWYFSRQKCPTCGARGTIGYSGSAVVNEEKGYGLVTRNDTVKTRRKDNSGKVVDETSTSSRQERAPVVRRTVRATYKCAACGYSYSKDSFRVEEDFSDRPEKEKETTIIQKEVVKVPCKYCGALNDLATDRYCTSCGAAVK